MRQIKFRGYSKSYKSWHYGSLELAKGNKYFIKSFLDNGAVARTRVDEESVGQWTGLADCKGNPIYEGDILADGSGIYYKVYWDDELAMFQIYGDCIAENFEYNLPTYFEVVGNIYEENLND